MKPLDRIQPYLIAGLFVVAGSLHFKNPAMYEKIMPPYIPAHEQLVALSGFVTPPVALAAGLAFALAPSACGQSGFGFPPYHPFPVLV